MTKAERLIYLINMIRGRGSLMVDEMSKECGVSLRTTYRDLESLVKMNIPIYYNNGYRLLDDQQLPLMELSSEEMDLVRYSLQNNPLVNNPYFRNRFHDIEQKIALRKGMKRKFGGRNLFLFERPVNSSASTRDSIMISDFVQAICESQKISVEFKGTGKKLVSVLPVAVKLRSSGNSLVVTSGRGMGLQELPVDEVESVQPTGERFSQHPADVTREPTMVGKN